eukprot:TRINITY_DN1600_c0_g1_i1.p1 TRINITY_DN1600_c0_g1~~TRINITY_DN1600_c0_g1_i1.p1  ORF type:complete len:175 (+),score=24.52 TRINITY_DN1600_c0_g1_i1:25-549(+)
MKKCERGNMLRVTNRKPDEPKVWDPCYTPLQQNEKFKWAGGVQDYDVVDIVVEPCSGVGRREGNDLEVMLEMLTKLDDKPTGAPVELPPSPRPTEAWTARPSPLPTQVLHKDNLLWMQKRETVCTTYTDSMCSQKWADLPAGKTNRCDPLLGGDPRTLIVCDGRSSETAKAHRG